MKLSIIIPVFNSEKHLKKCLESVFSQDLCSFDYEVIIINDGSYDLSKNIILNFKKRHHNLIFIDQQNQGVSAARNAGLEISKGEYITFIDSDDEIYPNSLSKIIQLIKDNNLDIFYPRIDGFDEMRNLLPPANTMYPDRIMQGLLHERRTLPATFYRKTLIGTVQFKNDITMGEDTVFNTMVQSGAERVMYSDIAYYLYFIRPNSLSSYATSNNAYTSYYKALLYLHIFKRDNFKTTNESANKYFDTVFLRFVMRIIEHGILPTLSITRLVYLRHILRKIEKIYLLLSLECNYKYISKQPVFFIVNQFILQIKIKLYRLIK